MTPEDVEARLARIRGIANAVDSEEAHAQEDAMRAEVLQAIASGSTADPAHLARLALSSGEIKFERWYA